MKEKLRVLKKFGLAQKSLFVLLVSSFAGSILVGQSTQSAPASPDTSTATPAVPAPAPYRNHPVRMPRRAIEFYGSVWGVESLSVKSVESDEIIRFSYRVVDPERAKPLNDKRAEPFLLDEQAHVKLVVPTMEKVGALRQSTTPEEGKSYWMAFSNKGRMVKRGDHVSIVIGNFRADGLIVE